MTDGSYKTFLEMRTLFSEFPPTFFTKLTKSELDKFKQLMQVADNLKPASQPKPKSRRSLISEQIYFQPKNIIFCLNLKKIFTKKKFSFIRYSFALIRCLFKEHQRLELKKNQPTRPKKKEPFSKEIGTDAEPPESESFMSVKDKKMLENLKKMFVLKKSDRKTNQIFVFWRNTWKKIIAKREKFLKKFEKISFKFGRTVFSSIFRYKNWKILAGNMLVKAIIPAVRSRKNKHFLMVFFRGRFYKPELATEKPEASDKGKIKKERVSLKMVKDTSIGIESAETFKNIEKKKSGGIVKKNKALLSRARPEAPRKIAKLEKNHKWALAFALLKWKKKYFSVKSGAQKRNNVISLAGDIVKSFKIRYQKRLCSILFENLKVKYLISIQNKNFKTYLMFKIISGIISNKQKIILYKAFRSIYAGHYKKSSMPTISIDLQSIQETENTGQILYKILKKIYLNSLLKKKVFAFISIQNFESNSPQYHQRVSSKNLSLALLKIIFFKKYLTFFEIKEKTFIIYKKFEFLIYSIQNALESSSSRALKFSMLMMKLVGLDTIHHFLLDIAKLHRKELVRSSFEDLKEYADDMGNFIFARNLFTGSLVRKIYYKRVSSSILKWQSYAQDMRLAEELGLATTLLVGKKKIENLEFEEDFYSENESIGFNIVIDPEEFDESENEDMSY